MSDEALRGSERRWRGAGGAPELARLVAARVRAGSLPAEAGALADRLAAGATSLDDVLVAALVGQPWARELLAEPLAEACAYHGADAALDVALDDGPASRAALAAWLRALRAIGGRVALGEAFTAVARRAWRQAAGHDPHADHHAGWLRRVEAALEAVAEWLGGDPAAPPTRKVQRFADWRSTSGEDEVEQLRRLVGHAVAALLAADDELPAELEGWLLEAHELLPPDALRPTIRDALAPPRLGLEPGAPR